MLQVCRKILVFVKSGMGVQRKAGKNDVITMSAQLVVG